jgi:hypothetical protein
MWPLRGTITQGYFALQHKHSSHIDDLLIKIKVIRRRGIACCANPVAD